MKKSILALSVAAALAAPLAAQADTILYGSARVSVDYNDEDVPFAIFTDPRPGYLNVGTTSSRAWDVVNNDSRLGVMGSEDLGGGLSAVYQYEFAVDVTEGGNFDNSNRPKFVGLKGGFGTLTLGTQETPYYHVAGITDIFNSGKTFTGTAWLGGSFNGKMLDLSGNTSRGSGSLVRADNSIYYTTPDFNGFSGEALLVMNGAKRITEVQGQKLTFENNPSNDIDLWNIAAKYSNGPFFAGVSYIKLNGSTDYSDKFGTNPPPINRTVSFDLDQWVAGLGYNSGPFSVGFIYEQGTLNEFGLRSNMSFNSVRWGGDDATNYYLSGSYTFGNNMISAAFGQLDPGTNGSNKIDNYVLGYQYNLSKRTRLWAEYIGRSTDPSAPYKQVSDTQNVYVLSPYGDQNAVSIGTRVDF
jgi:predicted porin